jgi:hypothetical protein
LKAFADFAAPEATAPEPVDVEDTPPPAEGGIPEPEGAHELAALSLGYTINLHLPSTSDIAVFNAIFKSLREHLLR